MKPAAKGRLDYKMDRLLSEYYSMVYHKVAKPEPIPKYMGTLFQVNREFLRLFVGSYNYLMLRELNSKNISEDAILELAKLSVMYEVLFYRIQYNLGLHRSAIKWCKYFYEEGKQAVPINPNLDHGLYEALLYNKVGNRDAALKIFNKALYILKFIRDADSDNYSDIQRIIRSYAINTPRISLATSNYMRYLSLCYYYMAHKDPFIRKIYGEDIMTHKWFKEGLHLRFDEFLVEPYTELNKASKKGARVFY